MEFLSQPTVAIAVIEVLLGILLLTKAADEFVEGAVNVSGAVKISPVVIGAVVVGFGTSAPELLVSGIAASNGDLDIGVGNVVGSNVANLTLVLGAVALIVPLFVSKAVVAREAPLSLFAVVLFAVFTIGGLSRLEGFVLLAVLAGTLAWIIIGGQAPPSDVEVEADASLGREGFRTFIGLVGTVAGAQLLVWGAEAIAEAIGITGGMVGFTLIAVGTSLPELVTGIVAARKGETELILGNLLGSNMFNSLAVGGVIAIIADSAIEDRGLATVGIVAMVLVTAAAWMFMVTRRKVDRFEAVILLVAYLVTVFILNSESTGIETALR